MAWVFREIQNEWFGGEYLQIEPADVERAFAAAEEVRGREWVLGETVDFGEIAPPSIGPRGGFNQFLRVYWFGKRLQSIAGVSGSDALVARLIAGDRAAESELTAVHLLRSGRPGTAVEIEPAAAVGGRERHPDFRIRSGDEYWTYVEVTQLRRSDASRRVMQLLDRLAERLISVEHAFILEIVLWRDPTAAEEDELAMEAHDVCRAPAGERRDVGDLASLFVKSGDVAAVVPSLISAEDPRPRMCLARSLAGPGHTNRQILVRVPFADQRAEDVLATEAAQLPSDAPGFVMVDVTAQPTAFNAWPDLVAARFTRGLHTRVGGVLLFSGAIMATKQGLAWIMSLKLIGNPRPRVPLAAWIAEVVDETRAETRSLTGRPD